MEILHALRDGPLLPNRLSQVCNLNYQRAVEMLDHLEKKGLVSRTPEGGHELFSLTPDGLEASMYYQWINAMVVGDAPATEDLPKRRAAPD